MCPGQGHLPAFQPAGGEEGKLVGSFASVRVFLSACMPACLSIYLWIYLSLSLSISLYSLLSTLYLSICLSVCLSVYLSICPSLSPSRPFSLPCLSVSLCLSHTRSSFSCLPLFLWDTLTRHVLSGLKHAQNLIRDASAGFVTKMPRSQTS